MSEKKDTRGNKPVESLFAQATTDLDAIGSVGKYIRTGRRWDLTHKDIVNDLVVINSAKEITTKFGEAMLCNIDHEGVQKTALFGGVVLRDQISELAPVLPVLAVVRKPARSYVLVDPTPEMINEYKEKYLS